MATRGKNSGPVDRCHCHSCRYFPCRKSALERVQRFESPIRSLLAHQCGDCYYGREFAASFGLAASHRLIWKVCGRWPGCTSVVSRPNCALFADWFGCGRVKIAACYQRRDTSLVDSYLNCCRNSRSFGVGCCYLHPFCAVHSCSRNNALGIGCHSGNRAGCGTVVDSSYR